MLENAMEEGVARLTTDAKEELTLRSISSVAELQLRSVLCVPLRVRRSRILGALYLDNSFERAVFDSEDLELAESFCAQAALGWAAMERRRQTAAHLRQLREANRKLQGQLDAVKAAAEELGVSPAELAIRFCASNPNVSCVIPGVRTVEQAELNAAAVAPLPPETMRKLLAG